jgi:hypothetical protein
VRCNTYLGTPLCTSSVRIRTYVLPRRRHEYELVDVRAYVRYGRVRADPNHFRTRARPNDRTDGGGRHPSSEMDGDGTRRTDGHRATSCARAATAARLLSSWSSKQFSWRKRLFYLIAAVRRGTNGRREPDHPPLNLRVQSQSD